MLLPLSCCQSSARVLNNCFVLRKPNLPPFGQLRQESEEAVRRPSVRPIVWGPGQLPAAVTFKSNARIIDEPGAPLPQAPAQTPLSPVCGSGSLEAGS